MDILLSFEVDITLTSNYIDIEMILTFEQFFMECKHVVTARL